MDWTTNKNGINAMTDDNGFLIGKPADSTKDLSLYPIDAFPAIPLAAAKSWAASLSCLPSIEYVAAGILAAAAVAIGNTRRIKIKDQWTEGSSLYLIQVGHSGTRKSPAIRGPLTVVEERQKQERQQYDLDKAQYDRDIEAWEKGSEKPKAPLCKRTVVVDTTTEALSVIMEQQTRGTLIKRDEISGWIRSMNAYREGRGSDREWYLSSWSNEYTSVTRKTQAPIDLDRPHLTIVGGIPPESISTLASRKTLEDGLLQRILFHWPSSHKIRFKSDAPNLQAEANFHALISTLFELNGDLALPLTDSALALFAQHHDELYIAMEAPNLPSAMRGHISKFSGYLGRLSLIMQLMTDPKSAFVDWEAVDRAWALIGYYKQAAAKLYGAIAEFNALDSPEGRCEKAILTTLRRRGAATRRDLQRNQNESSPVFRRTIEAMIANQVIKDSEGVWTLAQ